MDILTELKIGDKLEIQVRKVVSGDPIIVSQVADIKDDKLYIAEPMKAGMYYYLRTGQQISVIFQREDKGIFSFQAEVKERIENRLTFYRIEPVDHEVEKIQRRDFYRFEVAERVSIKERPDGQEQQGVTLDISGGGMKLRAKKPLNAGTVIDCVLTLEGVPLSLTGRILRCSLDPESREYTLNVIFQDIQESTRKKIISFIFEKQRLLRKKGLI